MRMRIMYHFSNGPVINMSDCKYCGCSGWFFALSKSGLCQNCGHMVSLEIAQRRDSFRDAAERASQTGNPHSKIARLDQALSHLEALAKLEERGIEALEGTASDQLKARKEERDRLILETSRRETEEALAKVSGAQGPKAKIATCQALLLKLSEYKLKLSDAAPLSLLERRLQDCAHQIRLNELLEKAKEEEDAGRRDSAYGLYREAAGFLKASDMDPDLRTRHLVRLNGKLKELKPK